MRLLQKRPLVDLRIFRLPVDLLREIINFKGKTIA